MAPALAASWRAHPIPENREIRFILAAWRLWLTAGCVAALLGLLLYVLANVDAWILYEDWWELAVTIAWLILLALAIGAIGATIGAVATVPLLLLRAGRGQPAIEAELASVAAALACGSLLLRAVTQWVDAVGLGTPPKPAKYLLWAIFLLALGATLLWSRARRIAASRLSEVFVNPVSRRVVIASAIGAAALATTSLPSLLRRAPRPQARLRSGPNILLITFDALSAEDMSVYGRPWPTTPFIDAFARTGSVFVNYFTSATFTTPSVASIMSGRYPSSIHVYQLGGYLRDADRTRTLIHELRTAGYVTAASVGNPWAFPNRVGLGGDFDLLPAPPLLHYRIPDELLRLPASDFFYDEATAEDFVATKIRQLTDAPYSRTSEFPPALSFRQAEGLLRRIEGRYFLWLHVFAPHAPYLPAAPYAGRFLGAIDETRLAAALDHLNYLREGLYPPELQPTLDTVRVRYDEWIAEADAAFGAFMAKAVEARWLDDTLVIVSADHGESFEGGVYGHGSPRQPRPMIHVPLIVRLPGQTQGRRASIVADHTALAPTILDLVGLKRPDWMDGSSLRPWLEGSGAGAAERLAFTQHLENNSVFKPIRNGTLGAIDGHYRYLHDIASGKGALALLSDAHLPGRDLSAAHPATAVALRRQLRTRFPLVLGSAT
jgi:arylsulfatase A-like enzyme